MPFTLFFTVTDREIRPGVHARYSGAERALPPPNRYSRDRACDSARTGERERESRAIVCMKEGGERGERASRVSN